MVTMSGRLNIQTVIILILFIFRPSVYSETAYKFDHLSLEQGISHNLTNCIIQDSKGFMWFATLFGLIKYDGTRYTVYRNVVSDPMTVSHDDILTIYEDHLGFLWVGTRGGGLNRFDRAKEQFMRFIHDPADSNSLSNNTVNAIDYRKHVHCAGDDGMHGGGRANTTDEADCVRRRR